MKNPDRHLQRTKTDSFRNPETLTSESDESDTSPQTPSDYDLEASNLSQNLANPDTTQHQTSSLLPNMSSANQTTASAQISSFSSSISSASSATPTASTHIKKKLKTLTPFSERDWRLQGRSRLVSEEKCLIHHFPRSRFQGFEKNPSWFFCRCRSGFFTVYDDCQRFWCLLQQGLGKSSV